MSKGLDCNYRVATPPKQANVCRLGRFGGLVTDGMCRRCIRDGLNVPKTDGPSIATKAANFATSAAKHVAAGMPQATEDEVARRFSICQGCEFFDGKACRKCGCPVVRERKFLSKLSWANEKCPAGKW